MIDLRNPGETARETERAVVDADARAGIRFVSCPEEDPDEFEDAGNETERYSANRSLTANERAVLERFSRAPAGS